MTKVKICGITNLEDALLSAKVGADALGFNFYEKSPRYIAPEKAREIISQLPQGILKVGVFVNESLDKIIDIAAIAKLDALQLHGEETPEFASELKAKTNLEIIKAFRVSPEFQPEDVLKYETDAILLDAYSPKEHGGTGETFDWEIAKKVQDIFPKMYLAGGLSNENVGDASEKLQPFAVDVCSSIESEEGKKNADKLLKFIEFAKNPYKQKKILSENDTARFLMNEWYNHYWHPMALYMEKNPELFKTFSGFLLRPEKLSFYLGKTHLGIEYHGSERIENIHQDYSMTLSYYDYSLSDISLLENIVGFNFDKGDIKLPLPEISEELISPTSEGADKLFELKWNFAAQNSIISFGGGGYEIKERQFTRIINSFFFDADDYGLITRHIKWLDFIPLNMDSSNYGVDKFTIGIWRMKNLVEHDCCYEYFIPEDYKFEKLPRINRFLELIGNIQTQEPEITQFLSQENNKFIITMRFGATRIFSEVLCEWQNEEKEAIKPDFFVLQPNGYADIVEFKLPDLKGKSLVGRSNRETFSAEINQYISQTRTYRHYFDDTSNRNWFEDKYGFKVYKPRRYLVAGRRWDFSTDEWKEIQSDYTDVTIMSYEDLIDGVVAQFYM